MERVILFALVAFTACQSNSQIPSKEISKEISEDLGLDNTVYFEMDTLFVKIFTNPDRIAHYTIINEVIFFSVLSATPLHNFDFIKVKFIENDHHTPIATFKWSEKEIDAYLSIVETYSNCNNNDHKDVISYLFHAFDNPDEINQHDDVLRAMFDQKGGEIHSDFKSKYPYEWFIRFAYDGLTSCKCDTTKNEFTNMAVIEDMIMVYSYDTTGYFKYGSRNIEKVINYCDSMNH